MSRPKILLVDDVNLIIQLEKNYLKHLPVDLLVAGNGEHALTMAKEERPDLVFLDLNMPVMDGTACCAALKADPELAAIPVVMVTTAGKPEDEELCRSAGCDDYITKPIDSQLFMEKARKYLKDFDRRQQRVECSAEVTITREGSNANARLSDISSGGAFIATDTPLPDDSSVELTLNLPGDEVAFISTKGRVVWENRDADRQKPLYPAGYGVEFTEIDPDAVSFIQAFVEGTKLDL